MSSSLLPFPEQLVCKESYSGMTALLAELSKNLRTIDKGLEAARKAADDKFIEVIGPYAADATARLAQLERDSEELAKGITKVVTYLGEDPKFATQDQESGEADFFHARTSPSTILDPSPSPYRPVFKTLWKFIEELRKVYSDYRLAQERAAAKARKEAAEAEAKAKKAAAAAARAAKAGK